MHCDKPANDRRWKATGFGSAESRAKFAYKLNRRAPRNELWRIQREHMKKDR